MKRINLGILILSTLVLTCACSKDSGTMTCTNKVDNGSYNIVMESKVNYENGYVTTLTTKEETKAPSDEAAQNFKDLLNNAYIKYNKLEGFTSTVEVSNQTVTSVTTIDYSIIDLEQLSKIDEANKAMVEDGKITIEKLKESFHSQGAVCK